MLEIVDRAYAGEILGKLMIFTVGWTPDFVIRPLVRIGLESSDSIVILGTKPRDDYSRKRFIETVRFVEDFISRLNMDINIIVDEVDIDSDISSSIVYIARRVMDIANSRRPSEILMFLVGGMRILVISALLAARLIAPLTTIPIKLYTAKEDSPEIIEIARDFLYTPNAIGEVSLRILELLSANPMTIEEIAEKLSRSIDSIRKNLRRLERRRLIEKADGRKKRYRLTKLGEIILAICKSIEK